jgi:hypothetical protein
MEKLLCSGITQPAAWLNPPQHTLTAGTESCRTHHSSPQKGRACQNGYAESITASQTPNSCLHAITRNTAPARHNPLAALPKDTPASLPAHSPLLPQQPSHPTPILPCHHSHNNAAEAQKKHSNPTRGPPTHPSCLAVLLQVAVPCCHQPRQNKPQRCLKLPLRQALQPRCKGFTRSSRQRLAAQRSLRGNTAQCSNAAAV